MTIIIDEIKPIRQLTSYTCGLGALRTVFHYYGFDVSEDELKKAGCIDENGTSHQQMRKLANNYNFRFYAKSNATLEDLKKWLKKDCPVIIDYQDYDYGRLGYNNGHYAVAYGIDDNFVYISDPANYNENDKKRFANNKKMEIDNFLKRWYDMDENQNETRRWMVIIRPK